MIGNVPEWFYRSRKNMCDYYGKGGVEVDLKEEYASEINSRRVYG